MINIVGFTEATLSLEILNLISATQSAKILLPDHLLNGNYASNDKFLIAVTLDKDLRKDLIDYLDKHKLFRATYIHPTVVINGSVNINGGTFIGPFASVFNRAEIEKDCIIAPYSMVSHNSKIGQGSILQPGVMVAGSTQIGQNCLLGIRSTIIDKINVCDNVMIGAGSLVTKSITAAGKYVGTPARKTA